MNVRVSSKRVQYNLTINSKYTIICGDSGTGKTTLYRLIQMYNEGVRSINVISDKPIHAASEMGTDWQHYLKTHDGEIIIIDEDSEWVTTGEFAKLAKESDNYYIIINREPIPMLPCKIINWR